MDSATRCVSKGERRKDSRKKARLVPSTLDGPAGHCTITSVGLWAKPMLGTDMPGRGLRPFSASQKPTRVATP